MPASGPQAVATPRRVLVIDDDALLRRSLARVLGALRPELQIHTASSGAHALEVLATQAFDAVITDLQMPGISGLAWLERLHHEHPELPCLVHSSQLESFGEDEVRRLCHAAFAKPVKTQLLLDALDSTWSQRLESTHAGLRSA